MYRIPHGGLAQLDEHLFNTFDGNQGIPWVMMGAGDYRPVDYAVEAGPGAFVAPDILERGFNAWADAPGYYVDAPFVDRTQPDTFVRIGLYQPKVMAVGAGGNPWDWVFGTMGSYGHDIGVGVREWPDQSGVYSLS